MLTWEAQRALSGWYLVSIRFRRFLPPFPARFRSEMGQPHLFLFRGETSPTLNQEISANLVQRRDLQEVQLLDGPPLLPRVQFRRYRAKVPHSLRNLPSTGKRRPRSLGLTFSRKREQVDRGQGVLVGSIQGLPKFRCQAAGKMLTPHRKADS
jgi:hypothetical protein